MIVNDDVYCCCPFKLKEQNKKRMKLYVEDKIFATRLEHEFLRLLIENVWS